MDEGGALPDVQGVLEDLNRQFGWAAPDARFFVVRSTSRPRSTMYLVSSERGGGVEVVVKTDRDEWDSIAAFLPGARANHAQSACVGFMPRLLRILSQALERFKA